MNILIIYLIGVVVGYYMLKYVINTQANLPREWKDVMFGFILSLTSWFCVITSLIIFVINLDDTSNSEPPKWL